MRWLILSVLLFAGGCECAKAVDDTGKKAAEEVTGAGTVKRGKRVRKKVEQVYDKAEEVRDKRVEELMKTE